MRLFENKLNLIIISVFILCEVFLFLHRTSVNQGSHFSSSNILIYYENTSLDIRLQSPVISVEEKFALRDSIIKEKCKVLGLNDGQVTASKDRFIHSPKNNFIVCLVAKAGASTWRQHVANIQQQISLYTKTLELKGNFTEIMLSNSSTKLITVRDPLSRLVSAYGDKFNFGEMTLTPEHISIWYRSAEQHLGISLGDGNNKTITFEQFLTYAIKHVYTDRHVRPAYLCCSPCKFHYDYILHLETFDEDVSYVFEKLNVTDSSSKIQINNKNRNHLDYEKFYRNLSQDSLKMVYDFVKIDLDLFNYRIPDFFHDVL